MNSNAMAGAMTLCGVGLCTIGGALMMTHSGSPALAGSLPASAVVAAASAQTEPTVVWYGIIHNPRFKHYYSGANQVITDSYEYSVLARAWSDGRVEAKKLCVGSNCGDGISGGGWYTVNDPSSGYRAAADINADQIVDGTDLASVLSNWGEAPRVQFPTSECPLNLINP